MADISMRIAKLFLKRIEGKPLFELGAVYATPGATALLSSLDLEPHEFINRHHRCDWGDLCQDDLDANQTALLDDTRLLSAYELGAGQRIWIITEADRASTTVLLPEEY